MPDLQIGTNAFDRDRGNFPKLPVINMFAEQEPTENAVSLLSRPGLENSGITMGNGPIAVLYQVDGVLSGELYGVSGGHLYKNATDLGAVNGTGPASIAGFENRVFTTQGQSLYAYDGAALTSIATPGAFNVRSLCIGTSRLVVIDDGSGHFYWSDVLSPTIGALSFATAENSPDKLKECLFIGDTLHLFGSETVEFWPASSSDPNLPYQPLVGRTFEVGIRDTGCATLFATTFAWITNHDQICVGDPQNVVSTPSLDEKLSQSVNAKLWTFYLDGIEFLAVTLDSSTWVFSKASSEWSMFQSYGEPNWIPVCYAGGTFGSSVDGQIIAWTNDYSDFGDILERRFRAGLPITSGTQAINNLILRTNPGQTNVLEGDYSNPIIELRTSRDGGFRWTPFRAKMLGEQGRYNLVVTWRSLGLYGFPGFLSEFRVTDPVPFRVSGLVANEPYATI